MAALLAHLLQDQSSLLVANAAKFKSWFNVDVKENTEASQYLKRTKQYCASACGISNKYKRESTVVKPMCTSRRLLPTRLCAFCALAQVVSIDCSARKVRTREVLTGKEADVPYDALVLAPGAAAIRPPLPGIDLPGIFVLKTIPDRYLITVP